MEWYPPFSSSRNCRFLEIRFCISQYLPNFSSFLILFCRYYRPWLGEHSIDSIPYGFCMFLSTYLNCLVPFLQQQNLSDDKHHDCIWTCLDENCCRLPPSVYRICFDGILLVLPIFFLLNVRSKFHYLFLHDEWWQSSRSL